MKLEEEIIKHAKYWDCFNDSPLKYNHTKKLIRITEKFALEFAEWRLTTPIKKVDEYTMKELLKIFKLERGY